MDASNTCQNNILKEEQINYMHPLPFCINWFRFIHPIISTHNKNANKLAVQAMNALQGKRPIGKLWNDRLHRVLETLDIK